MIVTSCIRSIPKSENPLSYLIDRSMYFLDNDSAQMNYRKQKTVKVAAELKKYLEELYDELDAMGNEGEMKLMNLVDLKTRCETIEKVVTEKYQQLCANMLRKDMAAYAAQLVGRMRKYSNDKYELDNAITISIAKEGYLWIEDRRATAFGWTFDVVLTEPIRLGDAFELNNQVYTVKYLKQEDFTSDVQGKVEQVIADFHAADVKLDTMTYAPYAFTSEQCGGLSFKNICEVIDKVLARDPVWY